MSSPLYATVVGLLMKGLKDNEKLKNTIPEIDEESYKKAPQEDAVPKKTIFEKWGEKFRDFLDNAE